MKKYFPLKSFLLIPAILLFVIASCKKNNSDNPNTRSTPPAPTPTKLGLYEVDSSIYKLLFVDISALGTTTVPYDLLFDTGSGGMVIDASDILPASMISSTGFNFTGDSTVVDGITITNQTSTVEYGDDAATTDKVYGNLAYANVTIGNTAGNIIIKRLPFFLYYKAVNGKGVAYPAHQYDTFGVSAEYDISFANNAHITSPFASFVPGTGLTSGFKMAALGTGNFTLEGNYVSDVLTLGLTSSDLSTAGGFTLNQLSFYPNDGYAPIVPGTISYNNRTFNADVVFDTGTEPYSYIEDPSAKANVTTPLPVNTAVTLATTSGFNYPFTVTATENLTNVENPSSSGSDISILSLEFFLNNEYLLDYTNHQLGVKSN